MIDHRELLKRLSSAIAAERARADAAEAALAVQKEANRLADSIDWRTAPPINEFQELERQLAAERAEVDHLKRQTSDLNEMLTSAVKEQDELREALAAERVNFNTLMRNMGVVERQLAPECARADAAEKELETYKRDRGELKFAITTAEAALAAERARGEQAEARRDFLEKERSGIASHYEDILDEQDKALAAERARGERMRVALERIAANRLTEPDPDEFAGRDSDDALIAEGRARAGYALAEIARAALATPPAEDGKGTSAGEEDTLFAACELLDKKRVRYATTIEGEPVVSSVIAALVAQLADPAAETVRAAEGERDILKRPYHWVIIPEDDGSFFGIIAEFPGCIASGDSAEEALRNLRDVAESWLEATIEQGQSVPEPRPFDYCAHTGLSLPAMPAAGTVRAAETYSPRPEGYQPTAEPIASTPPSGGSSIQRPVPGQPPEGAGAAKSILAAAEQRARDAGLDEAIAAIATINGADVQNGYAVAPDVHAAIVCNTIDVAAVCIRACKGQPAAEQRAALEKERAHLDQGPTKVFSGG